MQGDFGLGLLEEIAHLGSTHADKHLDKFRAGNREEGDIGLSGDRLCEQGLTGSGRAYKQYAFRHLRADCGVLTRIL